MLKFEDQIFVNIILVFFVVLSANKKLLLNSLKLKYLLYIPASVITLRILGLLLSISWF